MSEQDRPSREVAWRVFAAEFDDADFSYAESDEERAPNYVVTPTGARVNRLFAVGVLTEVEQVSDDVLRARIVDPTGAFVVYAGQYQPDALASLERMDTPAFVAVTGKARTFQPEDTDVVYTSIRPESISEVDADTRDRWVVRTAEQTVDRIGMVADALGHGERGDDLRQALVSASVRPDLAAGVPLAIDHYGTTETYLDALRDLSVEAAEVVAGERDEVETRTPSPDEGGPVETDLSGGLDIETEVEASAVEAGVEEPEGPVTEGAETGTEVTEPTETGGAADASPAAEEVEAETAEEPEPEAEIEAEPEAESAVEAEPEAVDVGDVGTTEELAESTAPEPEAVEPEPEESESDLGDFTSETESGESAVGEMYEFDEEERQEIEEEFDMGFSTGEDIPEAGEAGIEPEAAEPEPEADFEDSEEEPEFEVEPEEPEEETEGGFEGDLEDIVVDVMDDLDEGDGVARDEVIRTVVEEYDADTGDVEEAIQSALMSGRCYESSEDTLKAI